MVAAFPVRDLYFSPLGYICVYICTYVYPCVAARVFVSMRVCTRVFVCLCVNVCVHVCLHECVSLAVCPSLGFSPFPSLCRSVAVENFKEHASQFRPQG